MVSPIQPEVRTPDLAARCRQGAEAADCPRLGWKRAAPEHSAEAGLYPLAAGSLREVFQDMEAPKARGGRYLGHAFPPFGFMAIGGKGAFCLALPCAYSMR